MQEFNTIRDFKRRKCNQKSVDLEPWDEDYYIGMMKSSTHSVDPSVCAIFLRDILMIKSMLNILFRPYSSYLLLISLCEDILCIYRLVEAN
jgi:Zn-dependent oligopeptidase